MTKLPRRSVRLIGFLTATCLIAQPVLADTLREALTLTYENNPNIAAARAQLRASDEGVVLASAPGRPSASGTATYTEFVIQSGQGDVPGSVPSTNGPNRSVGANVTLSVPLYQGGLVQNNIGAANSNIAAGRAQLRATESAVFSQVVAAYMDVIRDQAIVELNMSNVQALTINLEAARDRFEIGDLTRTDVAQSEARLSLGQSNLESARANLIRSRENYIALVGKAPVNLQPPPPLPNLPSSPEEAVAIALENNPDLLAAQSEIDAARYSRRAANAGRLPTVAAFVRPGYSNFLGSFESSVANVQFQQGGFDTTFGVQANIPIYQGGAASARIRQAQALLGAAQEREIAVERGIIAQTRSAYSSWQASLAVIRSSERQVAASELSLEGVRAENSVGTRTILDILNAEQELLNAQVQLVTARRNAYVAGFTLLAAMGRAEARDLGLDGGALYDPLVNYERASRTWLDWSGVPADPEPTATRTVDTPPQKADIQK